MKVRERPVLTATSGNKGSTWAFGRCIARLES
jgi:hypothetical protein